MGVTGVDFVRERWTELVSCSPICCDEERRDEELVVVGPSPFEETLRRVYADLAVEGERQSSSFDGGRVGDGAICFTQNLCLWTSRRVPLGLLSGSY